MTITQQFIDFVFNSDPSIKLDHDAKFDESSSIANLYDPYCGCAVGKFKDVYYPDHSALYVSMLLAEDTALTDIDGEMFEAFRDVLGDINDIVLMTRVAPYMGALAQFISISHPTIANLAVIKA